MTAARGEGREEERVRGGQREKEKEMAKLPLYYIVLLRWSQAGLR